MSDIIILDAFWEVAFANLSCPICGQKMSEWFKGDEQRHFRCMPCEILMDITLGTEPKEVTP